MTQTHDLQEVFRNASGSELKSGYTQYSDLRASSSNKDNYFGASNNDVVAVTAMSDNQVLFLPINGSEKTHRVHTDERSAYISSGQVQCGAFNPFDQTLIALLNENKSTSPSNVGLAFARYNEAHLQNIVELNKNVEVLADYEGIHAKRAIDVKWHPLVEDVLFTAGDAEIKMFKHSNGDIEEIAVFSSEENNGLVTDFSLSYDGRFLFATFQITGANILCAFDASYGGSTEPLASIKIGSGQQPKVGALADGEIIVSRLNRGSRQLVAYSFDDASSQFKQIGSGEDIPGTTSCKIRPLSWHNCFCVYGRGDMSVQFFCLNNGKIAHIGGYKTQKSIMGMFYCHENFINPAKFELQRFFVARGSTNSCTLSMAALTLPRSGSYLTTDTYQPMLHDKPSLSFDAWTTHGKGPITKNTIDPMNYDEFMAVNGIEAEGGAGGTMRKPTTIKKKTPSKQMPAANHSAAKKLEPKKSYDDMVGQSIQTVQPPVRRSMDSNKTIVDLTARVVALEDLVKAQQSEMEVLRNMVNAKLDVDLDSQ